MTASKERRMGLLFISPFIIGFLTFTIFPVIASIFYSVCDYDAVRPPAFVGLANYREMFHDERFTKGLWNTLVYTLFALPVTMLTALVLSFLLNMKLRGQGGLPDHLLSAEHRAHRRVQRALALAPQQRLWPRELNPSAHPRPRQQRAGHVAVPRRAGSAIRATRNRR